MGYRGFIPKGDRVLSFKNGILRVSWGKKKGAHAGFCVNTTFFRITAQIARRGSIEIAHSSTTTFHTFDAQQLSAAADTKITR
jgi:hypothetical protein